MNFKRYYKYAVILLFTFFLILFFLVWKVIDGNYDKQNKAILFLKELVPQKIARKIRDVIFIVPDLKTLNQNLTLQVQKYEQGFEGQLFQEKKLEYKKKKIEYKNFFLPFPRLDVRLGYKNPKSSLRSHYLEIIRDKVLVISGEGKTIFFEKKNIFKDRLDQKEVPNNISSIMVENNLRFAGVRDLFFKDNKVYISLITENKNGFSFNIYHSDLNYKQLSFELLFASNTYFKNWSVSSGGRIEEFKNNKILFSLGTSDVPGTAQDKNTLLGKIISIDLDTKEFEVLSMGHRNPQGLEYLANKDLIINSEHGPKGGDEINFNYVKNGEIKNFGWDIASYGAPYFGKDLYKKSHKKFGFVEPFKFFNPSIGISEIIFLEKENSFNKKNTLIISSLRAGSLYVLEINDELNLIEKETRLNFGADRIRDLKYDYEYGVFFLLFEITPSVVILKF
jgi:hypothetical protein